MQFVLSLTMLCPYSRCVLMFVKAILVESKQRVSRSTYSEIACGMKLPPSGPLTVKAPSSLI